MGIKYGLKKALVCHALKKRKKSSKFDEILSESYELPADAGTDYNNSYYFCAHNKNGTSMFFRLGIRGGGTREVWFVYYDRQGNAFVNSAEIYEEDKNPAFVKCIEPLKKWEFGFKGKVKRVKPDENLIARPYGEELNASFFGVFSCTEKLYDFTRDSDARNFAAAVAAEKWAKGFMDELNANTQTHIEQAGICSGTLSAGGVTLKVDSEGIRDHSYGRRDWNYMNRHIWLASVCPKGRTLNTSWVNYPALKELQSGYEVQHGLTKNVLVATSLIKMPDSGMPKEFNYFIMLSDKSLLKNKCTLEIAFPFSFGNGAYIMYEGLGSFNINGEQGRGTIEFGYNSDISRWKNK